MPTWKYRVTLNRPAEGPGSEIPDSALWTDPSQVESVSGNTITLTYPDEDTAAEQLWVFTTSSPPITDWERIPPYGEDGKSRYRVTLDRDVDPPPSGDEVLWADEPGNIVSIDGNEIELFADSSTVSDLRSSSVVADITALGGGGSPTPPADPLRNVSARFVTADSEVAVGGSFSGEVELTNNGSSAVAPEVAVRIAQGGAWDGPYTTVAGRVEPGSSETFSFEITGDIADGQPIGGTVMAGILPSADTTGMNDLDRVTFDLVQPYTAEFVDYATNVTESDPFTGTVRITNRTESSISPRITVGTGDLGDNSGAGQDLRGPNTSVGGSVAANSSREFGFSIDGSYINNAYPPGEVDAGVVAQSPPREGDILETVTFDLRTPGRVVITDVNPPDPIDPTEVDLP